MSRERCDLCGWAPKTLDERESFLPLDEVICSSGRIAPACTRCWLAWPHGHKRRVQWQLRCPRPTTAEILDVLRDRSAA